MTHFADQGQYAVRCEWDAGGMAALAPADIYMVVDVLSFCTTVDIAVARGTTVLPCGNPHDASAYAAANQAILAGGRSGWQVPWSISPRSMQEIPAGTRIVVPSPNGSRLASLASQRGATVIAGSLRNARAVAHWAAAHGQTFALIAAGERWEDGSLRPALEDMIGVGAIAEHLPGARSPDVEVAIILFGWAKDRLAEVLCALASGRELVQSGYTEDVLLAAALNCSEAVPLLQGNTFVDILQENFS